MTDKVFVDTNVLVYAFDRDEPAKRKTSLAILGGDDVLVLSTQVLQEFYVTVTRKLKRPLPVPAATEAVRELARLEILNVDTSTILEAIETSTTHTLSFWDALVVCTASAGGCVRVLSEDLQLGRDIRGLRIVNPYAR